VKSTSYASVQPASILAPFAINAFQ